MKLARQVVSVGETYDFEFQPESGGKAQFEVFRRANKTRTLMRAVID